MYRANCKTVPACTHQFSVRSRAARFEQHTLCRAACGCTGLLSGYAFRDILVHPIIECICCRTRCAQRCQARETPAREEGVVGGLKLSGGLSESRRGCTNLRHLSIVPCAADKRFKEPGPRLKGSAGNLLP